MRISPERIKELQKLLKEQTGRDYSDEEASEAGLAIIRFVAAKEHRKMTLQRIGDDASEVQPKQASTKEAVPDKNYTEASDNLVELVELLTGLDEKQKANPNTSDDQGVSSSMKKDEKLFFRHILNNGLI